ncbi:hypothetical protein Hanom_Chr16g01500791 [Helianthus anomalus]
MSVQSSNRKNYKQSKKPLTSVILSSNDELLVLPFNKKQLYLRSCERRKRMFRTLPCYKFPNIKLE